ncbi:MULTISPECIES: acetyl-CoA C-acyltransferase [Sphingopyxis]|jgi:acetyl-CoA C-acetyltransferase|uniref:Acetyl-CoA C-acetyltransferase n=2 Tax=Sphingopyxis terrae TaxID=33052 RepID=A0A1Y6FYR8_9SPHN|nr:MULTISPECIES: acetyl-CoA C-acyltransferase [Sphingopyxis]AMU95736.1 acetyl-CoA acetyltransferase [Sphingopyxis terrae subsp. terrae NBRC 15098]KTE74770.1 acetyl-CoA acetyltransferase [Sphingopyxis sp. A083]MBD3746106.1 acetyl-CoA C-acyltransferase [Sphingopyxis terrae]MBU7588689.1 acetyl-CoA C-acyltransferase [Sphingopyxis terrae]MDX8358016.1 acetyl-CoA C-acyltransferase [Sphingopyxis terrae]
MTATDPVVFLSYARTPMGGMQGVLSDASATDLGATAVKAAVERAGVAGDDVERIYMGCVLPAGLGQAPARQAAIKAGLPKSVQATTVNKVCGSGMQTVIMGAEALAAGSIDLVVAGGMESMTNAPYLLKKHRSGARIGHDTAYDHMFLDGLEDAYDAGRAMGTFAQDTADAYQLSRQAQDDYSIESLKRAQAAIADGAFAAEITPVTLTTRKGEVVVDTDEQPGKGNPDKIPTLRPAFAKDGTITAATSSSISDGAAAVVLTRQSVAEAKGKKPVAKLVAHAAHAQEPKDFTVAPVGAINKVLAKAGWSIGDVDLFEVNEAFACVAMFAMHDLGISHDKINVHGGATALGHPIGASGTRIITTLIAALQRHGKKRGIASLCIGGGEATAVAVELV